MYHHHVQEMTTKLVEAGLATDVQQVEIVLSNYWLDKIAVVWCIDDVHGIQEDFDQEKGKSSLSDEQALLILLSAFDNHDCNRGITWEDLRYWSRELLEEAENSAAIVRKFRHGEAAHR